MTRPVPPTLLLTRRLTVDRLDGGARALFPSLRPGDNLARLVFLGTGPFSVADAGAQVVAALRSVRQSDESEPNDSGTDDTELRHIVGELSTMSRAFSTEWAHGTERLRTSGIVHTAHPAAGTVRLGYRITAVHGDPDRVAVVWRGADSASRALLRRLSSEI